MARPAAQDAPTDLTSSYSTLPASVCTSTKVWLSSWPQEGCEGQARLMPFPTHPVVGVRRCEGENGIGRGREGVTTGREGAARETKRSQSGRERKILFQEQTRTFSQGASGGRPTVAIQQALLSANTRGAIVLGNWQCFDFRKETESL